MKGNGSSEAMIKGGRQYMIEVELTGRDLRRAVERIEKNNKRKLEKKRKK